MNKQQKELVLSLMKQYQHCVYPSNVQWVGTKKADYIHLCHMLHKEKIPYESSLGADNWYVCISTDNVAKTPSVSGQNISWSTIGIIGVACLAVLGITAVANR